MSFGGVEQAVPDWLDARIIELASAQDSECDLSLTPALDWLRE